MGKVRQYALHLQINRYMYMVRQGLLQLCYDIHVTVQYGLYMYDSQNSVLTMWKFSKASLKPVP